MSKELLNRYVRKTRNAVMNLNLKIKNLRDTLKAVSQRKTRSELWA